MNDTNYFLTTSTHRDKNIRVCTLFHNFECKRSKNYSAMRTSISRLRNNIDLSVLNHTTHMRKDLISHRFSIHLVERTFNATTTLNRIDFPEFEFNVGSLFIRCVDLQSISKRECKKWKFNHVFVLPPADHTHS